MSSVGRPVATYRVQLNRDFGFNDALALLPHLHALGISDLYTSPVFQAKHGSTHGYDVTDPSRLNPDLGTAEDFDRLTAELRARDMGLLLDIVPNHMAASPENPWWMDVLENGSASPFSVFFDIEWEPRAPSVLERIVLPVLGEPYGEALEGGKLRLGLDRRGLSVGYGGGRAFPFDPATWRQVLAYRLDELLTRLSADTPFLHDFGLLLEQCEKLPSRSTVEWESLEMRQREIPQIKQKLWDAYSAYPEIREYIDHNIATFNGVPGDPHSFDLLHRLLDTQPYQLAYWKVAREKLNYRRFFDVSDLVGIRARDPQVFEATHRYVLQLLDQGKVTGFRVDHIDGLYDPLAYLTRLQERKPVYVVAEKILSGDERLPAGWPVAGTTGYDFLTVLNNVFIDSDGLQRIESTWREHTGVNATFEEIAHTEKKRAMEDLFAGETAALTYRLSLLAEKDRYARDLSPIDLRRALIEVTASLPVYRTYIRDFQIAAADRAFIEQALASARSRCPEIHPACFDYLARILLLNDPEDEEALRFVMRWQQLSGPIMAKGVEDTTLYLYTPLVSMNDVGHRQRAVSVAAFHEFNTERQAHWPSTMNATSTHDTKRSEDVRARINVLSEMPAAWARRLKRWTHRWKKTVPDANEEYLLYQTLLGSWPISADRLKSYMTKAAREAKVHTSWQAPNPDYEEALSGFVDAILADSEFLADLLKFHQRVAFYGAINSLAQTLLKIASPGVPDFYQGTTSWDFSLVDPDNRRPIHWTEDERKTELIRKSLHFRKQNTDLFTAGDYVPLESTGRGERHLIAFARHFNGTWAIAAVPRCTSQLSSLERLPVGRRTWKDSLLRLPPSAPARWTNVLTGERLRAKESTLAVNEILATSPVALLGG